MKNQQTTFFVIRNVYIRHYIWAPLYLKMWDQGHFNRVVKKRFNITRNCMKHYIRWGLMYIIICTHKRQPIPRPIVTRVILTVLVKKRFNITRNCMKHYISWGWIYIIICIHKSPPIHYPIVRIVEETAHIITTPHYYSEVRCKYYLRIDTLQNAPLYYWTKQCEITEIIWMSYPWTSRHGCEFNFSLPIARIPHQKIEIERPTGVDCQFKLASKTT